MSARPRNIFQVIRPPCSYSSFLPGISEFLNFDPVYNFSQVNGQLVVQREGVYHVFAQVFFENYPDAPSIYHNRVELTINEKPIVVMQTPIGNQADYGSESSGAVLRLNKGDLIGHFKFGIVGMLLGTINVSCNVLLGVI